MRAARARFSTRLGFIMAAIGSGLSLGNLWRFPYLTGQNGGGAFVLLYVFFVAAVGLPILISELMLGKLSQRNLVGSFKEAVPSASKYWSWLGGIGIFASVLVLSYYAVVSGWVIHFVVQGIMGAFSQGPEHAGHVIDSLREKGLLQVLLASVHLMLTATIVAAGVRNGIERWARFFMPIYLVVLVALVMHSLLMPGATKALRFLFYPDFSKLTGNAVIEALGHAFFTLSVGFGAMVAYGSYLKKDVSVPTEGVFVAGVDTLLSILAGLLVFPIVYSFNVQAGLGPSLLFKTMPVLFGTFSLGPLIGVAFFICLYVSALSSSIVLFEGVVSYLMDEKKMKRKQASTMLSMVTLVLAIISALSSTAFRDVRIGERGLFEIFDQVIINWTIPVVGLGISIFMGWRLTDGRKQEEFVDENSLSSVRLFPTWQLAIRWIAPGLLILMFLIQIFTSIFI